MLWHRFVMKKFQALAQLMEKVGVNFELFFCYTCTYYFIIYMYMAESNFCSMPLHVYVCLELKLFL